MKQLNKLSAYLAILMIHNKLTPEFSCWSQLQLEWFCSTKLIYSSWVDCLDSINKMQLCSCPHICQPMTSYKSAAQSTKYLSIIFWLSATMPKLRLTYNRRLTYKTSREGFPQVRFTCKIVRWSEIVFTNQLMTFLREILARCKSL